MGNGLRVCGGGWMWVGVSVGGCEGKKGDMIGVNLSRGS